MAVARLITAICLLAGLYGLLCLPAYVIAERCRVRSPGVAFIPRTFTAEIRN